MIDSEKTEAAFFGALLSEPAASVVRAMDAGVTEDWFVCDPWAVVWLAAVALWKRSGAPGMDALSIFEEAKRQAAGEAGKRFPSARLEFSTFEEALGSTFVDVTAHIPDLREARMVRRWRALQGRAAKTMESINCETALLEVRSEIDDILSGEASRHSVNFEDVLSRCEDEAREAYHMRVDPNGPKDLNWTPGFKLPWPQLTGYLGGLEAGLHVIAARPSVGKTSFAANLVRFWCDMGYKVTVNSLDMSTGGLIWRFLSERARVSIKKARFTPTMEDLKALADARAAWSGKSPDVCQIRDVDDFAVRCKILKASGRLQIVVVDYLGLLHSRNVNNGNEYERVSYVSDALKNLSLELGVPVVALAQLNREVAKSDKKRMPGLSDLRGSGSIEQDAYTVTLLHRDEYVVDVAWKDAPPVQLVQRPASYYPGMKVYGLEALDAVWAIVCKAQNYGTGLLPFVVRKNYFVWQLADYEAQPIVMETGAGNNKVTFNNNAPYFSRVHSDWRHDPLEEVLERQGALIRGAGYAAQDERAPRLPIPDAPAPEPAKQEPPEEDDYPSYDDEENED